MASDDAPKSKRKRGRPKRIYQIEPGIQKGSLILTGLRRWHPKNQLGQVECICMECKNKVWIYTSNFFTKTKGQGSNRCGDCRKEIGTWRQVREKHTGRFTEDFMI